MGTGGWGQLGGVGVRAIRGVRVGDCVHTRSSYVINNPLGFWVGTGGWGQGGGLGLGELGGLGSGIVFTRILQSIDLACTARKCRTLFAMTPQA